LQLINDSHYKTHGPFYLSITSICLQESQDQDHNKAEDATPMSKPTTKETKATRRSIDSSRSHTDTLLTIDTRRVTLPQLLSSIVNIMTVAEASAEVHQEKAVIEDTRTIHQEAQDNPTTSTAVQTDPVKAKDEHTSNTPVNEEEISRTSSLMTREAVEANTNLSRPRVDKIQTLKASPKVDLYSKN
jgi:hypothetical protein